MDLEAQPLYWRGLELLGAGEYFESHEALEQVWRQSRGEQRLFLQALVHLAVGYYHGAGNNAEGARLQLRKCVKKLAGYLPAYGGLDTRAVYQAATRALEAAGSGRALPPLPRLPVLP